MLVERDQNRPTDRKKRNVGLAWRDICLLFLLYCLLLVHLKGPMIALRGPRSAAAIVDVDVFINRALFSSFFLLLLVFFFNISIISNHTGGPAARTFVRSMSLSIYVQSLF